MQGGTGVNVSRNEHTIATTCKVSGRGYWSGNNVSVKISPAPVGTGVVLVRSDLPGKPECLALASHRHDAALRTNLANGPARFELVEHLMASLYAMEIDNCIVEIDGEEFPGLDGSSAPYVAALQSAGLIIQAREKTRLVINEPMTLRSGDRWIKAAPLESGNSDRGLALFEYQLSFDKRGPIPDQRFRFECSANRFAREVAPARTFVTQSQADALRAQGVAGHVTNRDLLVFADQGPIENKLRFKNECARHKTLDLIGDLALTGLQLVGEFVSYRGGHNLNGLMASHLIQLAQQQSSGQSGGTAELPFQNKRAA